MLEDKYIDYRVIYRFNIERTLCCKARHMTHKYLKYTYLVHRNAASNSNLIIFEHFHVVSRICIWNEESNFSMIICNVLIYGK